MKESQTRSRHWNYNHAKQDGALDSDLAGWISILLIAALGTITILYALNTGV